MRRQMVWKSSIQQKDHVYIHALFKKGKNYIYLVTTKVFFPMSPIKIYNYIRLMTYDTKALTEHNMFAISAGKFIHMCILWLSWRENSLSFKFFIFMCWCYVLR
jgi:hypothetical protein